MDVTPQRKRRRIPLRAEAEPPELRSRLSGRDFWGSGRVKADRFMNYASGTGPGVGCVGPGEASRDSFFFFAGRDS